MTSRWLISLSLLLPATALAADPDAFPVPSAAPVHEVELLSVPVDDAVPAAEDEQPGDVGETVQIERAADAPLAVPADAAPPANAAPPADAPPPPMPLAVPAASPTAAPPPEPVTSFPATIDVQPAAMPRPVLPPPAPAPLPAPPAVVQEAEPAGPLKRTGQWFGRAASNTWKATRKGWGATRDAFSKEKKVEADEEPVDLQASHMAPEPTQAAAPQTAEPEPFHTATHDRPLAVPGNAPPPRDSYREPKRAQSPAQVEPVQAEPVVASAHQMQSDEERRRRKAGVFLGVTHDTTTIADQRARDFGVEGGIHLYRRLLLGGALHGVQSADGSLGFAYGGFQPGITWRTDKRLHLRTDMLWGLGMVEDGGSVMPVNVFMPRLAVELNVGRVIKLDAHAGYRKIPGNQPKADELSGWQLGVGARLGTF